MNFNNNITRKVLAIAVFGLAVTGCQKMDRPQLGDYAKDANPPGGPLKFFTAFDGTNVDSTRANFGVNNNVTFVDGITGKAASFGDKGYISYAKANDFKTATSFTVAFWLKKNGPNPAGKGTAFAFGLGTTTDIWTRQDMFLLFEDAGNPSSTDSAAAKFYLNDQWFEFIKEKRLPKVLNGQWHHLAFSFDQGTSILTTYIDGTAYTNLPAGFGKFTNNGGKVNLSNSTGIVVGGPGHYAIGKTPDDWMGTFGGQIDQFRLYGTALSAAEINSLYTNKK
ncbi:MAG TPA: LamG domain-containing protein [Flavisolibacter sp.]|jgi:hypothetical protein|nr:LamG domain-containing protein [Flavisolibacter sp.]